MRLRYDQKLFFSYLAVIVAVVVVLTFGVGTTLRRHLTGMVASDLRHELALARQIYDDHAGSLPPDSVTDWLAGLGSRRVTVVAPDGNVVGDSERDGAGLGELENHAGRPEIREALTGKTGEARRMSSSVGVEHLYVAVRAADGHVLRLAVPLREMHAAVGRVQRAIFGVGLVAMVLTGFLSFGFSFAVTRPLRHLVAVARAMAGGDLARRARLRGRDELAELSDALDTLAAELQRRLRQLEGERAEMSALIDAMAEAVIAVDASGRVQRANPAARRIFNLPPDARGLSPEEVARRPGFLEVVRQVMDGTRVAPVDLTQDGRHLLATAQPLPAGGAVMVFLDVSELRRLEDVRRDFVANASHELKTPLTAIRGFSETLLDDQLPPPLRRQFAETVKANADRLQRIVDDLLDLSRIETGGWRVQPEIVSVEEIAREALVPCRRQAEEKRARLLFRVPHECEFVHADPSALRQVFTNLLGNAIRYLPEGGMIEVSAASASAPPPRGEEEEGALPREWIQISVRDTGAGIPSAHLPRIFERFYRVDMARSREEGGTGLGLAIVKHLVEGHGGSIEAESQLGRGTIIRFTLPAALEMEEGHGVDEGHGAEDGHGPGEAVEEGVHLGGLADG